MDGGAQTEAEDIPGPDPFVISNLEEPETPGLVSTSLNTPAHPDFSRRQSSAFLQPQEPETGALAVSIPGLVDRTLFLPIPATDPLSTLLAKYVPEPQQRPTRDISGDWTSFDFHTMVITHNWRALAYMAKDRIILAKPDDLNLVLGLWYLRLNCLARMRLYNQASAECNNVFAVLQTVEPAAVRETIFEFILPFELDVFRTRLRYWASDPYGYLDELAALLANCRKKARHSIDQAVTDTWDERCSRLHLIIASQLVEMKDLVAATTFLDPLYQTGSPELCSAIGRLYLQSGQLRLAEVCFQKVASDATANNELVNTNAAMQAMAIGDWESARQILVQSHGKSPADVVIANNIAIALLSEGRLQEGIAASESVLKTAPATVLTSEPYLFNLATLYELCSATASERKTSLLLAAATWNGDGLKTSVLKLG